MSNILSKRIQYYTYVNNYLRNSDGAYRCVKRVGSKSKNAVIHLCKGTIGIGRIIKFVSKQYQQNAKKDINLSLRLSSLVLKDINPHFNIVYRMQPNNELFSEAASGDLKSFLKEYIRYDVMINCLQQVLICVLSFHIHCEMMHSDCHQGNFLYCRIKKGGYIHYNVNGRDLYVPNLGYIWMINDFDLVEETGQEEYYKDYKDAMEALVAYKRIKKFSKKMEAIIAAIEGNCDDYGLFNCLLDKIQLFETEPNNEIIINNNIYIL
jgi:hypothetical protein